jgi:hypothetical protein
MTYQKVTPEFPTLDWITFSVPERGHLIVGEYQVGDVLVSVRDLRGRIKSKIRDENEPVIEAASLLLRELAYGLQESALPAID